MKFNAKVLLLFLLCIVLNCAGTQETRETSFSESDVQNSQKPQGTSKESTTSGPPIPPDCPLAKIKEGMGDQEVIDILGRPKDQEGYATGKQWIPFYFGPDTHRQVFFYKGLGQIHFSAGRVVYIQYDPAEDGYR